MNPNNEQEHSENQCDNVETNTLDRDQTTQPLTRREVLALLKRRLQDRRVSQDVGEITQLDVISPLSEEQSPQQERHTVTRRQFLQYIGALGLAFALNHHAGTKIAHALERVYSRDESMRSQTHAIPETSNPPEQPTITDAEYPEMTDTFIESTLLTLGYYATMPILKTLHIQHGNRTLSEQDIRLIRDTSIYDALMIWAVYPAIIEEPLFRLLPSLIIGKKGGNVWEVGIPVSAFFALLHNVKRVRDDDNDAMKYILAMDSIPVHQFISGLFFWKLMRERGFPHTIVAHGTVNGTAIALGRILYRAFPPRTPAISTRTT